MSTPFRPGPFSRLQSKAPQTRAAAFDSSDSLADEPVEDCYERLLCLEKYICELLTKNQQLRMALMELKSRGEEAGDSLQPISSGQDVRDQSS